MHGLVHQTLKRYVVEKTDEASWEAVRERAGLEKKLYLQVTHYDDSEFDAVLEALSAMSGHDRRAIERDVGRSLASPLLQTFRVHVPEGDLTTLLDELEDLTDALHNGGTPSDPPTLTSHRVDSADDTPRTVRVTYRSEREYCSMAHGILEGLATAYGEPATVTETACVRDGDDACVFDVRFEEPE